jgi:hypothetical protein
MSVNVERGKWYTPRLNRSMTASVLFIIHNVTCLISVALNLSLLYLGEALVHR